MNTPEGKGLLQRFDPDVLAGIEDQILNRMNQFDVSQSRIEARIAETYVILAHFVLYWLTHTEPIPDGERNAAQALGKRQFDYFIDQVAKRIEQERS